MSVQLPINSNSLLTCGFSMFDSMLASGFSFAGKVCIVILNVELAIFNLSSVATSAKVFYPAVKHFIFRYWTGY